MTFRVHWRVGLRDNKILFAIPGQIIDLIGHTALLHFSVGRFDETKFVDPGKSAHRADETDVRTFWRFDRTDAAVVRRMDVAHFEPGAVAAQTTGPERGKTTLV